MNTKKEDSIVEIAKKCNFTTWSEIGRAGKDYVDVAIRRATEMDANPGTLIHKMFFEGGTILACQRGEFVFKFDDGEEVTLPPSHFIVVYPDNFVTIECTAPDSHLNYVILNGPDVDVYLDSFGFYDHLRFKADLQYPTFQTMTSTFPDNELIGMSLLTDMLHTFEQEFKRQKNGAFFEVVKVIHRNLRNGIVRIQPLCQELNISRTYLHNIFLKNGIESPGDFIRREQLKIAKKLLKETRMPIAEVAKRIGIPSPIYFTAFIRRLTGHIPSEIRGEGAEDRV